MDNIIPEEVTDLMTKIVWDPTLKKIEVPLLPVEVVKEYYEAYSFEMEELTGEGNIMGWEVSFWYYFKHPSSGKRLEYSGSLHYGDCKIIVVDEGRVS